MRRHTTSLPLRGITSFLTNEEQVKISLATINAQFKAARAKGLTLDTYLSAKLTDLGFTVTEVKPPLSAEEFSQALANKEIWPDSQIPSISHGTYPHLIQMLLLANCEEFNSTNIADLYSSIGTRDLNKLRQASQSEEAIGNYDLLWFRLFDLEALHDLEQAPALFRSPYFVTGYICLHSDEYPELAEALITSQCIAFNTLFKIENPEDDRSHLELFKTGTLSDSSMIMAKYASLRHDCRDINIAYNYLANIFRIRALQRAITQDYLPLFSQSPVLSYLEFFTIVKQAFISPTGQDYFLRYYRNLIDDLRSCSITTSLEGKPDERSKVIQLKLGETSLPFFYLDEQYWQIGKTKGNIFSLSNSYLSEPDDLLSDIKEIPSFQQKFLAEICMMIDDIASRLQHPEQKKMRRCFQAFFKEPQEEWRSPRCSGLYLQFKSDASLRIAEREIYKNRFMEAVDSHRQSESFKFFRRSRLPANPSWLQIFEHALQKPSSRTANILLEIGLDFRSEKVRNFFTEREATLESEDDDTLSDSSTSSLK